MSMSKSRAGIRGILAFATACAFGFSAATSATALSEKTGYLECNANRSLYVTSNTAGGTPFIVSHQLLGGGSSTRTAPGYFSTKFASGGQWGINTNGTLISGGASCAA